MFYKITNKKSKVYKELYDLRMEERQMKIDNEKAIEEKTGMTFLNFLGHQGQFNFSRVDVYEGFVFNETEKIDANVWVKHKEHDTVYIPNRKTKAGKEMYNFINYELKSSFYQRPLDILGIKSPIGEFKLPFMEVFGDIILLKLDDKEEPKDKNVIEITSKEFNKIITISKF